jgi:nitrogen fixation protein FixH
MNVLLLISLIVGVGLIFTSNLLLLRLTTLTPLQAAAGVALAILGICLPWAIVAWPGSDVLAIRLAIYLMTTFVCGIYFNVRRSLNGSHHKPWHWGPAAITGFFVVLIIVDSVFILLAARGLSPQLSTQLLPGAPDKGPVSSVFPGVISHDFQEKEALYNVYLQQRRQQIERGWQVRKGWLTKPIQGEPTAFKVAAQTRYGEPLSGAVVTGQFLRPADSRLDKNFLLPEVAPGVYQGEFSLPAPGRWNVVLQLQRDGQTHEIRASTSVLAR